MGVRLVGEPGALVALKQRGLRLVARPVDPAVRVRILLRPEAAHAPPEHPTSAHSGQQKRSTPFDAVHGERGEEAHLGGCGDIHHKMQDPRREDTQQLPEILNLYE